MPSESGYIIPVALVSAIVTFLLTSARYSLARWWTSLSSMKDSRVDWYREVIRIARETRMDVMSGIAGSKAHESMMTLDEEDAMKMIDLQQVAENIDSEDLAAEDLNSEDVLEAVEGDYESVVEMADERVNEVLESNPFKEQQQKDLNEKYNQLKTHWASVRFNIPEETAEDLDEFIQQLYVNSMYPGISEDKAEVIDEAADQLLKSCHSDIESIESKKTRWSLKNEF